MASTLIKSDLSVIDRVWVDDPLPDNVPGDFYGNGGGGGNGGDGGTGATLPTGTPTNDFVGGDLISGGLASSPGGSSPPNPSNGGNNDGGGDNNDPDYETIIVPANPNNPSDTDHTIRIPVLPDNTSGVET